MTKPHASSSVKLPASLIYLAFILAGIGIGQMINEPSLALPEWSTRALAVIFVIGGLVLDGWGSGQLRRQQGQAAALITTGAFGFSRHPSYLGYALIYCGFGFVMDSPMVLVLGLPCVLIINQFLIPREEADLAARFGAAYEAYRQKVRRWL